MRQHDDFEPLAGLPERPPSDERILWQGRPAWRVLATRGFRLRLVGGYFVVLAAFAALAALQAGAPAALAATQAGWLLALGAAACGLIALYAWLSAQHTVFTITDRRVVIRSGIALDMAVNLPFRLIESAALKPSRDGVGDIALTIARPHRVALLALLPFARAWHLRRPQPVLRAVPQAALVARVLARALAATGGTVTLPAAEAARPETAPVGAHA